MEKLKQVIRVEHPVDGWGLFRTNCDAPGAEELIKVESDNCLASLMDRHWSFPTAYGELRKLGMWLDCEQFCSFKSIDQMENWITKDEFAKIIALGFKIYVLELSDCIELPNQVVYYKKDILSTTDITDLFK